MRRSSLAVRVVLLIVSIVALTALVHDLQHIEVCIEQTALFRFEETP